MTGAGPFVFPGISTRVLFGSGTLDHLADELAALGHRAALILTTPGQAGRGAAVADRLGRAAAGVFAEAEMHTPTAVSERAVAAYEASGATCVIAIGGGSTVGLAKAIALRTGADQIVIPTTYAGSEMTDVLGETSNGEKTTRRDPAIRPEVVIYDVDLTLTLPVSVTVASALNAIAHGIEGLYAPDANPITDMMALDAMRAFRTGLPQVVADPGNQEAREKVLYGAWLCSTALGHVSMALHHKLCHVLGGSFGLPHAETHAVMLPHTARFNAVAVPDKLAPVAEIFGGSVGGGLWDFARANDAPLNLADLGMSKADLDRAAEIATRNPYDNPRPFDREDIRSILGAAWQGERPET